MGATLCVICGADTLDVISTAVGDRVYCRTCFHGWRTTIPGFDYSSVAMCTKGTNSTRLQSQVSFVAPFLNSGASVLEVGCASGEFAATMRGKLPVGHYTAIELSPMGEKARAHVDELHTLPLDELLLHGMMTGPFDPIVLSHVLEHLEDIHHEVSVLGGLLSPNGALFIEVPNRSGHQNLPFDDNASHLHFFSTTSLSRLLAAHGLEIQAAETSARLDARYADSIRIVARAFTPPQINTHLLSTLPRLADERSIVVWGAGSMAHEVLANFLNSAQIDFFIDGNASKHGSTCLGRPVLPPEALGPEPRTILIASVDFADEICSEIKLRYPGTAHKLIRIEDIFNDGIDGKRR
jgi:2-polyprenyl-3-methyl-5-hydroxy-6-metoxy-1,4-benzoquinol methylase